MFLRALTQSAEEILFAISVNNGRAPLSSLAVFLNNQNILGVKKISSLNLFSF